MTKSIVIVNQEAGYLTIDIVNYLSDSGWDCYLITGKLKPRGSHLAASVKLNFIKEYKKTNSINRIYTWIYGSLQIYYLIFFKFRNYKFLFFSNPPFGLFASLLVKSKYFLYIFDVYPDILVTNKFFSNKSFFIKFWVFLNKLAFSGAVHIFTLSNGMKNSIKQYVSNTPISVVPIWIDPTVFKVVNKKDNPFVINNNLTDMFVVMYSGNIGNSHSVDSILDVAELNKDNEIVFFIIGDGSKKKDLIIKYNSMSIDNCKFLPFQDFETFTYSISAADIAIITSDINNENLLVPSKFYSFIASGVPVVALCSKNSELAKLIEFHDVGRAFGFNEIYNVNIYIEKLKLNKNELNRLKMNCLNASKIYSPELIKNVVQYF